jgi:hypothetical protein
MSKKFVKGRREMQNSREDRGNGRLVDDLKGEQMS